MNTTIMSVLAVSYRQEVASPIFRIIRAGDSCSIVGVSGTAKSNLYRHLLNPAVRQHYLGDAWQSYLFLAADSHALSQLSERAMYDLLLERLAAGIREGVADSESVAMVEQLRQQALSSSDPLDWQFALSRAVHSTLTSDTTHHLVSLFDQFDEIYETLNPRFFANLRSLRDHFKYRVSYVTFTREELPRIRSDVEHNEFYELLSPNIIGLGCYNRDDAWTLLRRIGRRYGLETEPSLGDRLITLTGGHPGLLKAVYMTIIHGNFTPSETDQQSIEALLAHLDVRTECGKIWESIRQDERETLVKLACGVSVIPGSPDIMRRLAFKGLITEKDKTAVFCPLFAEYASRQISSLVTATETPLQPIYIDSAGETWVEGTRLKPRLAPLEFALLKYFCSRPGELCTRSDIIEAIYPDEVQQEGVSDDALNSVVQRLRKRIEPDRPGPQYILTVRGLGYRLNM